MRIAYYVHLNFGADSGVFKKIVGQVMTWTEMGHEVRLFVFTRMREMTEVLKSSSIASLAECKVYRHGNGGFSFVTRDRALSRLMRDVRLWHPEVIYSRIDMWYPAVWRIAQQIPLVLEINGDELAELRRYSLPFYLYSLCTRGLTLGSARGSVYVSHEIEAMPANRRHRKPSLVLGNGLRMEDAPPLPERERAGDNPRLAFIGQAGMPWHGVDRVLAIARAFRDWRFDLIGITAAEIGEPLPENVTAWGSMRSSDYRSAILPYCDCGIGSLAMFRAHLTEASPLKTREYLALGLPVIIGYSDTDFLDGADFLLQLPNTGDNVESNLPAIHDFVERWRGRRVNRRDVMHLDSRTKERVRLEFIESVISGRGATSQT